MRNENKFICFEGIDYSGKTTLARELVKSLSIPYGYRVAPEYEQRELLIHSNPDHMARFLFFLEEIVARSDLLRDSLVQNSAVVDRYLLSVFAYHNVLLSKQLEKEFLPLGLIMPDFTVLLVVGVDSLEQRMAKRPPRHVYESNLEFLLKVQEEYLRLTTSQSDNVIIDTSNKSVQETSLSVIEAVKGALSDV